MTVKEKIVQLIDLYNTIFRKIERDGIVYREISPRFKNGKEILCKTEAFLNEFGECEINGRTCFDFEDAHYEILKPVNYLSEMDKIIQESPIIVGDDFAVEMRGYERNVDKECLLIGEFFNDIRQL